MKSVIKAIELIDRSYKKALTGEYDYFICQLTNSDKGYNREQLNSAVSKNT